MRTFPSSSPQRGVCDDQDFYVICREFATETAARNATKAASGDLPSVYFLMRRGLERAAEFADGADDVTEAAGRRDSSTKRPLVILKSRACPHDVARGPT
jgi:hypothetical protein